MADPFVDCTVCRISAELAARATALSQVQQCSVKAMLMSW